MLSVGQVKIRLSIGRMSNGAVDLVPLFSIWETRVRFPIHKSVITIELFLFSSVASVK